MVISAGAVDIPTVYREVGTHPGAVGTCGVSHKTVKRDAERVCL